VLTSLSPNPITPHHCQVGKPESMLPPLLNTLTSEPERLRWVQWNRAGSVTLHETMALLLNTHRVPLVVDPTGAGADAVACLAHTCGKRLVRLGGEDLCDPGPGPGTSTTAAPGDPSVPEAGPSAHPAGTDTQGLAWLWGTLPVVDHGPLTSPKAGEIIGGGSSLRPHGAGDRTASGAASGAKAGASGPPGRAPGRGLRGRASMPTQSLGAGGAGGARGGGNAGAPVGSVVDPLAEALDGYLRSSDALTLAPLVGSVASPRSTTRPKRSRVASLDPGLLRQQTRSPVEGPPSARPSFEFDVGEPGAVGVPAGEVGEGADGAIADVISWLARSARRRRLEAMGKKTLLSWAARQRYKRALAVLLTPLQKAPGSTGEEVSASVCGLGERGFGWLGR
jgi:hypothetical protein